MAISKDDFIAGANDETPWSDIEWASFKDFVKSCEVILLGRRTYEIMRDGDEFIDGPEYVVVTKDMSANTGDLKKISIQSPRDMPRVSKLGIIGGGDLNGSLMKLGVVDEVILDKEPIELTQGIKLFGDHKVNPKLKLIETKELGEGTVQFRYKVISD